MADTIEKNPLERPTKLKSWSQDLLNVLKGQEKAIFEDFSWRPGRNLTRADFGHILGKIRACGSVVELRASVDRQTGLVGSPAVHAANYCGQHTICPYCAGRVQDRRGARFREPIRAAAAKYRHAYMLTATIPPVPTWREDLESLISAWQSFRRMGQKRAGRRGGRSAGEWGKVRAGVAKVELKRGAGSGLPHCHFHALVFCDVPLDYRVFANPEIKRRYYAGEKSARPMASVMRDGVEVPVSKISFEWLKATGGSALNIRVDKIKYREDHKKKGLSWPDSVCVQSREVLKYSTKFDSHPKQGHEKLFARDFLEIRDATYGRRLFMTYGDFRSVLGNDFTGGGPAFREGPLIWEARWRYQDNKYSDLVERNKPVFLNSEVTEQSRINQSRLSRVQGVIRRVRRAIRECRDDYFQGKILRPAVFLKKEFLEDGGFNEFPVTLEVPAYLAMEPSDPGAWEKWMDAATETGRASYANLREQINLEGQERYLGTKEERAELERRIRMVRYSEPDYDARVVREFLEVLQSCGPP